LLEQVRLAADTSAPVLIVGAPGTGKRLVARAIHQMSAGRNQPLIPFDSEALPAEILERELFAALKDSDPRTLDPSHAVPERRPRLALGEGSTLLIREIFMLPRDLQARLAGSLDSSIRLIGTTVLDPEIALSTERIRPDLYYALTTLVIRLHPLRDRLHELPLLAQHLLERANQRGGVQRTGFSPEALSGLLEYDWPGNLTELARVIDHAHAQGPGGRSSITADDLPASIRGNLGAAYLPPPPLQHSLKPLDRILIEVEQQSIDHALRQARGNKSRAAELLGISRPRLYRRIKELNLPDDADSSDEPSSES
jgi:DNA-binding NtrC family response regulator